MQSRFWRIWGVTPAGSLTRAFVAGSGESWTPGWNTARCSHRRIHTGPAPAPQCFCGWHVLTTESAAWDLVRSRHRVGPLAVGAVETLGPVLSGNARVWNDPPETRRVGVAAVAGELFLNREARPYGAALCTYYSVAVCGPWPLDDGPLRRGCQLPADD